MHYTNRLKGRNVWMSIGQSTTHSSHFALMKDDCLCKKVMRSHGVYTLNFACTCACGVWSAKWDKNRSPATTFVVAPRVRPRAKRHVQQSRPLNAQTRRVKYACSNRVRSTHVQYTDAQTFQAHLEKALPHSLPRGCGFTRRVCFVCAFTMQCLFSTDIQTCTAAVR